MLDKMLNAEIIILIDYKDIKCCGVTTLAKKAHDGGGLTIDELQQWLNKQCCKRNYKMCQPTPKPLHQKGAMSSSA
jgi:hypothetical protein